MSCKKKVWPITTLKQTEPSLNNNVLLLISPNPTQTGLQEASVWQKFTKVEECKEHFG